MVRDREEWSVTKSVYVKGRPEERGKVAWWVK